MDTLNQNGQKHGIKKNQNSGYSNAILPVVNKGFEHSNSISNDRNNVLPVVISTGQFVRVNDKRPKRQRRANEIQVLRAKLKRPLNSVEIDRLYKGYRKIEKCSKRKNCQCYHCELLRASTSDESLSSDASTGGEENESLLGCLKIMSSMRDGNVLPQFYSHRSSFTMPQIGFSSDPQSLSAFCRNNDYTFSEADEKKGFCFRIKKFILSILISTVYFLRWLCVSTTRFICLKLCKRGTRKIKPIHGKMSPVASFTHENKLAKRVDANGDNTEELISVNVHSPKQ